MNANHTLSNREKRREQNRRSYASNREKRREQNRKSYASNRENRKERSRKYRLRMRAILDAIKQLGLINEEDFK